MAPLRNQTLRAVGRRRNQRADADVTTMLVSSSSQRSGPSSEGGGCCGGEGLDMGLATESISDLTSSI